MTRSDRSLAAADALATRFRAAGHVTVSSIFSDDEINEAAGEIETWSEEVLDRLTPEEREWYLERGGNSPQLRKLDQPVYHRAVFRRMAESSKLCSWARRLTGAASLRVCFSQVFMKPPGIGGPKPVHQDNFYFGPDRNDAMLTAWVAIDEATEQNGCLYYGHGSHRGPVLPHAAPADEPFNLQVSETDARAFQFEPAPVPRGGVSLHHGNTLHCSSANTSDRPRRAVAIHYLDRAARLVRPALTYNEAFYVDVG